jgi:TonB family protein
MRESDMQTSEKPLWVPSFASLAEPNPWGSFSVSFLAQAVLLVALAKTSISLMAPIFMPVDVNDSVQWVAVELLPPEPAKVNESPKPLPPVRPKPEVRVLKQVPPSIEPPKQRVEVAKVTPPSLPVSDNLNSPDVAPEPKHPRAVTPNFSGSSAPVTEKRPARQVQTGGFGDPNGVPANPNSAGKGPTIPKLGSFDLPQGSGEGNGQGGGKGVRGTVASAGFGNGIATQGEGGPYGRNGQGKVRSTDFGSVYAAPSEPVRKQVPGAATKDTPVSLLTKPIPIYTAEARQRKVEGDVELDVEFTAQGQVHVLGVLQGLGYGLDEAAVRAVEQIHFAPARHDGRAVDSRGRLKVVFRLS